MKKFLMLMLPVLLVSVAGVSVAAADKSVAVSTGDSSAAGASDKTLAAAALADEGWGLLGGRGQTPPFYAEPTCDAPEMARERFRRAVGLDPGNAAAWRGWGRAESALGACLTGYGGLVTWTQAAGLDYLDYSELAFLPLSRAQAAYAAAAEATPKFRRAAELAPDDPEVLDDLGRNLLLLIWGEKDLDARLRLVDEALAAYDRSRELAPEPADPWSVWDQEFILTIAREPERIVWQRLLAGLLRLYDQQAETGTDVPEELAAGRPAQRVPDRETAWRRTVVQLLDPALVPPERLDLEKARSLLSAAHIRAVRLADLPLPEKQDEPQSAGHFVAVGEEPAPAADSSVAVVKKTGQIDPKVTQRLRDRSLPGRVELRQAALEPGFPQWQSLVESAGRHYWSMIDSLKALHFPDGRVGRLADQAGHFQAIDEWLEAAEREPRDDRRLILALGAQGFLEDAVKLRQSAADQRPDYIDEPARYFLYMMKIAGVMPRGEKREALLARAESGFSGLAETARPTDSPGFFESARLKWAEALIELSRREKDFDRFKALVDRAGELVRQGLEEAAPGNSTDLARRLTRLAMTYHQWLMAEKNPDHRRYFLETGLARFEEAVQARPNLMLSGLPGALYSGVMGDMYFQLSELSAQDEGRRRMWFNLAAQHYRRADEYRRSERNQPWMANDALFRLGQIHAHVYAVRNQEPRDLLTAVSAWREFFSYVPAAAEVQYHPRLLPDGRPDPAEQNFQQYVTTEAASRLMAVRGVLDFDRLDAWGLTTLAGLYRQLAVSAMVTPEYQDLYLGRAENMLRQAVERAVEAAARADEVQETRPGKLGIPNAEYQLGTTDKLNHKQPERDAYRQAAEFDLALAKAELGLVLSERTLGGGPCGEGGRDCLAEAEKLWREAESLREGSSQYARARWAAWLGDEEGVKALIRHHRDQVGRRLFPPLAEAIQDPAFDDFRDRPWFKKQWYGFVR